ncbi:hypothetical protein [Portibacter lacus]|uniref:Uncharacterized protein n=1 Tax=Portibacter lacus TaxID=1099794 RepID=A0AA37SRG1_9BACT|nr:hypothetical protein [Portibacter lacus]GLR16490.1 hypothetical protein GCM10007940_11050 [Portibacter lacus]
MKVLTITLSFLLIAIFSNAQIIVDNNGRVGLGDKYETTTSVPSSYDFEIDGEVNILLDGNEGFRFGEGGVEFLTPRTDFGGNLGSIWTRMN